METDFSAIGAEDVCVIALPHDNYEEAAVKLAKHVAEMFDSICYVTLNEPITEKREGFQKADVPLDKFLFIDGVTQADDVDEKDKENCIFVGARAPLTELNIAIEKSIETEEIAVLVIDSLSTLLIKHNSDKISQFTQKIATAAKEAGIAAVFTIVEGEEEEEALLKDIGMFVDEISD